MTFEPRVPAILPPHTKDDVDILLDGGVLELSCNGNNVGRVADGRDWVANELGRVVL